MGGGAQELSGPDFVKGVQLADLADGKPLLGHAEGESVVMVRVGEDVHAIGASCTHYGGPLAEGLVAGKTIRCPWHHACFDLETGRAEGAPAFGAVACWQVERAGELVQVRTKKTPPVPTPKKQPKSVIMVGAGAASAACAEMLRQQGYTGPITMFGAEDPGPVDRPNLSKDYLAGSAPEEWIPLGGAEHWAELKVGLAIDPVTEINTTAKTVTTKAGKTVSYDALLYATGAEPMRLPIPGAEKAFTLRSLADSRAIIAQASKGAKAVVIGTSFIGLEVAASLAKREVEVHVVAPEAVPLGRVLGDEVGAFVKKVHEEKGTKFHLGKKPKAIHDKSVELDDGTTLDADFVVMGVGVKPRVGLAEAAGLKVDGGVVVNARLETSAPDVWAAGDVVRYPDGSRIEHWVVAERNGQHVARAMLGSDAPYTDIAFFWSAHHDVTISYVGHALGDDATIEGSLANKDAKITYKTDGKVTAIATINRDMQSLEAEAFLRFS